MTVSQYGYRGPALPGLPRSPRPLETLPPLPPTFDGEVEPVPHLEDLGPLQLGHPRLLNHLPGGSSATRPPREVGVILVDQVLFDPPVAVARRKKDDFLEEVFGNKIHLVYGVVAISESVHCLVEKLSFIRAND